MSLFLALSSSSCMISFQFRQFDHDNDGKLSYIEFQEQPFNLYKTYVGFENSGLVAVEPKEKFAELDANKDRFVHI